MSVSFTRLKITGFKSFSDPISLDILPGLTGIIGPNGCGKSNIVEAIRWVMGESSAKSLRGGEMDDVIFAGTVRRAARNIAEVALTLDGTQNIAPPPFQQQDQLQISRQIERGSGSQYRMNGKVQRARDIQTFFADLGSGPRSSAIISQNRIAQLISASPEERRQVLEEAAGIAGLYSRRREAELKLKATEENLARLDDLRQQLSELILSLTEQSAQASTYRSLSYALRETETNLQCLYFQRALKNIDLCTQKVITSEQTQHEIQQQLEKNQLALENIENTLPKTRQQETQTRIEWEQKRYQVKNLKEEEDRLNQQIVQLQERVKEADLTYQAANTRLNNTKQDLNNYQEQFDKTVSEIEQHPEKEQQSNDKIQQLKEKNEVLTRNLQEAEEILRQKNIKINEITQRYHQAKQKKETLEEEYHILSVEYETCLQHLPKEETLQTLLQEQQNAQTNLAQITIEKKQLEDQINQAKLNSSEKQYHVKHVQEKYTQLNQQIEQTIQNLANIKHEQDTLNAQSINLQNQCHSQDELSQLTIKIEQLQTTLDQAKITAEQALFTHQDSIKKRLEQEASYSEAKRLYETRQQTLTSAKQSFTQSKNRLETLSRQVDQAKNNLIDKKEVETAEHSFNLQKTGKDTLFTQLNTLKESFQVEQTNLENAKASLSQHDHQIQRLEAKRDGLSQALSHDQDENHDKDALLPAIAETISIPEEWIATIAAIFDETLELPESTEGKTGWSILPEIDSDFPEYIIKLSSIIPPSPPLQRIFNAIGIVDHFYDGEELFSQLQAGQILVTRQGDIWRWDGYHQKAGKQTKAAQRLLQRQVLKQTEQELEELWKITPVLQQNLTLVEETYTNLSSELNQTQTNYQAQEKSYQQAQQTFISLQNKAHAAQSNFDAVHPSFLQAQEEFTEKELYLQNAEKEATLPKPDTAMVERHKQQEQEYQQEAQKAHQLLKAIEHQFDQAKEQQQKALNINQQNHIRLEALKEKITHLDDDHQKQIQYEQDLKQQLQQAEQPQHAQDELAKVQKQVENLQNTLKEKNTAYQAIEQALQSTQQTYQQLKEKFIQQNSRLETLTPKRDTAKKLLDDAVVIFQNAEKTYQNCPVTTLEDEQLRDLHNELTRSKEQEEQERLAHHLLLNQKETLFKEKETLIIQIRDWEARLTQTDQETANTQSKLKVSQEELSSLTKKPILIKEKIIHLEQLEQETSNLYLQAQQQLNTLEQQRQDAQKALQQAEQNAIKIRENLLKAQAKQEQAEALLEQLKNNIPPDIQIIAQQPSESELDLSDQTERKLKTTILELTTERDALGAVNLRAEIEREEKQTTLTIIEKEYADLATAIQQLRDSIQKLNQQGKEKLNAIFSEVDQHFQELFTRMFNGGHAYLKLLAHEDPLQCGLEIYVQPPGKKLSTLSLLSGGEQALTALSLVFAVSRCNPVPICVLDEVDAPLDDPNVERFCTLLSDMTEQAGTRFLVVTHHQLTMSHMHRLYGVTMQERGVSQIISIDLEHAVQMQQDKHEAQPGLI